MLILFVLMLATSDTSWGIGVQNSLVFCILLFGIVLLHEFGHCFAARRVGGDANEILLSPLGGLAFADAPNRPWPQFFTAAGGPLVNVGICLLTAIVMAALNWHKADIPLNPLSHAFRVPYDRPAEYFLWWTFLLSWSLLLFNLLPIFPLDGGRLLQTLLWFKLGYYRASMIACVVGMAGSVLMVMVGITGFGTWYGLILVFIGASCFITCFQMRAQLKAAGPWEFQDEGVDYGASLWRAEESHRKHKKLSRRAMRRMRKQTARDEAEQAHIDAILAKVSAHGMQSLTWRERRALHKATERQRRREMEVTGDRG